MECKHKNKLNHANFCETECRYCTFQQEVECNRKHPEYFKVYMHSVEDILSRIMGSLDFTESYDDAYWYIYRSETSLEDDLEELRNVISKYIK